jgi:hypothetical protein
MDGIVNKTIKYLPEFDPDYLQKQFKSVNKILNSSRIFKRISSTKDNEQIKDYIVEIWFSLAFAGLGFDLEIEPLGKKDPDLKISRDDRQAFVEIRRFRKIYSGPPEIDISDNKEILLELPEYGNIHRDVEKAFRKIISKFTQVGKENSIIAIWNDDGDMEETHIRTAVAKLVEDGFKNIIPIPEGLFCVLYGSEWAHVGDEKQLYCFPLKRSQHSYQETWQKELESSTLKKLINKGISRPI